MFTTFTYMASCCLFFSRLVKSLPMDQIDWPKILYLKYWLEDGGVRDFSFSSSIKRALNPGVSICFLQSDNSTVVWIIF